MMEIRIAFISIPPCDCSLDLREDYFPNHAFINKVEIERVKMTSLGPLGVDELNSGLGLYAGGARLE